jgi:predicted RNase H-like nuclease (RuvC/YqgF family)
MDAGDDGRWMTYDELAEARGIDRQSARRMANRSHWRRQKDNRGTVRVYVPIEQAIRARRHSSAGTSADRPAPTSAGTSVDMSADMPADTQRAITALEASLAVLREQLDRAEAGQGLERNRADRAENRADAAEKRADGAESRADRLDQALAGERARVDELRDRLEDLQSRLGQLEAEGAAADVQTAQLTAQLKQIRAEAQEAAQAASELLRQAEAARQGRGRWARLRAAWRGE